MDLFDKKGIAPMLIGQEGKPFDSDEYLFELKLDGERCLAYLDPAGGTELINKRGVKMLPKVPELSEIHKQVKKRCILDGELLVITDGKPDFPAIQKRSLMSNPLKIELESRQHPACFTAFDILYYQDKEIMKLPLTERKELLGKVVESESSRLAISRTIEQQGKAFYELAKQQELEGIVAKRRDSLYYPGKRTKDWIKIKYLQDDDFIVLGYIPKSNHMTSVVLGQYKEEQMVYKRHVTLGVGGMDFEKMKDTHKQDAPPIQVPPGNEDAVWLTPELVCTVKFMTRTANGGMRQPVFKGLRADKRPEECLDTT